MIRTFGLGPRAKNDVFGRLGQDFGRKSSANPRGSVKTRRWGKWPFSGPFSGPRMAISCQKRRPCFVNFPNVSRVFVYFSPHNTTQHTHHTTRISLCFLWFSVFFHTHNTAQHTHSQPHTRTHTCTPATDRDLESGLSKCVSVNTRKNPRNMPEKGKVRGISGEGSFRYGRVNRSSAAKWRMTNRTI